MSIISRPLVVLAVCYCLGIVAGSFLSVNLYLVFIITVFTLVSFLPIKQKLFLVSVLVLAFIFGIFSIKNYAVLPGCHIVKCLKYNDAEIYQVRGFIDSQPERKGDSTEFILRAQQLQNNSVRYKCCGKLLVVLRFPLDLNYGQTLLLTGVLRRPAQFNQNKHTYRDYLSAQGIYLLMKVDSSLGVVDTGKFQGNWLIKYSLSFRQGSQKIISRYLEPVAAGILSAMILGERKGVPRLVNNAMIKSGTVHILVVSGFNVGLVAYTVNLLLNMMCIRRKGRIILVAACILLYCFITGLSNPVVRATVMGLFFIFAYFFKRDPDIYNSLASAALFILIINPKQLFDLGFQLSFSSVLAIVYIFPRLKTLLKVPVYKLRLCNFVFEGFLVSVSAWLGTFAIILYNNSLFAPITVLANIVIVPLASLITLAGFALLFIGAFCPFLAGFCGLTIGFMISCLLQINDAVIKLPFAYCYL